MLQSATLVMRRWVIASLLGCALGGLAAFVFGFPLWLIGAMLGESGGNPWLANTLSFGAPPAIFGFVLALSQRLIALRGLTPSPAAWTLLSTLGWFGFLPMMILLGGWVSRLLPMVILLAGWLAVTVLGLDQGPFRPYLGDLSFLSLGGVVFGAAQALALRRFGRRALWWWLANALAWPLCLVVVNALTWPFYLYPIHALFQFALTTVLLFSVVTAPALAWLVAATGKTVEPVGTGV
jgi:hypothetical protein